MGGITVFGGPERRRRWSDQERRQILEEAFAPGACVAQVARRHDVSIALIYTWRRKLCDAAQAARIEDGFVEAVVLEDQVREAVPMQPAIVVDLARGGRVSIFGSASPAVAAAVMKVLIR